MSTINHTQKRCLFLAYKLFRACGRITRSTEVETKYPINEESFYAFRPKATRLHVHLFSSLNQCKTRNHFLFLNRLHI